MCSGWGRVTALDSACGSAARGGPWVCLCLGAGASADVCARVCARARARPVAGADVWEGGRPPRGRVWVLGVCGGPVGVSAADLGEAGRVGDWRRTRCPRSCLPRGGDVVPAPACLCAGACACRGRRDFSSGPGSGLSVPPAWQQGRGPARTGVQGPRRGAESGGPLPGKHAWRQRERAVSHRQPAGLGGLRGAEGRAAAHPPHGV